MRAGGVVLATGGCAFMSRLIGCHTNTGDGYLMAAEAGAGLSGMEFSNYYTISSANSTMTRPVSYAFATFFDESGRKLDLPSISGNKYTPALARALLDGPVFACIDHMPADIQARMPYVQPAFNLPFVRNGIDPYTQKFEVTLRGEGTVRGTGGLKVVDDDCQSEVRGLFVAVTPHRASWWQAPRQAAARRIRPGRCRRANGPAAAPRCWRRATGAAPATQCNAIGEAGLRPTQTRAPIATGAIIKAVQARCIPTTRICSRSGAKLTASLQVLEDLWRETRAHLQGDGVAQVRARETASLVASARWCYTAALARRESRGMHQRDDAPQEDASLARRLSIRGLDGIVTEFVAPQAAS